VRTDPDVTVPSEAEAPLLHLHSLRDEHSHCGEMRAITGYWQYGEIASMFGERRQYKTNLTAN